MSSILIQVFGEMKIKKNPTIVERVHFHRDGLSACGIRDFLHRMSPAMSEHQRQVVMSDDLGPAQDSGLAQRLRLKFQDCKKLLASPFWKSRIGGSGIESNGFAKAVEVGSAVWTLFQVLFEGATLRGRELSIEFLANMLQNVLAMYWLLFHDVM
jgi:hypothetical protein